MKHSLSYFSTLSSLSLLTFGLHTMAQQPGVDFNSPGLQSKTSPFNLGYEFTVNKPISIIGLADFDYNQDGFAQPEEVGLWTVSGTLLASTYINNSDPLHGFWRLHLIRPIKLTVGQSYIVGAQGGEGYTFMTTGFKVSPDITYIQDRYHIFGTGTSNPLTLPERTRNISEARGGGFFGGNIVFNTIPEPGAYTMIGSLALTGVAFMRRKPN